MPPRVVSLPPEVPLLPDGSRVGGWWHAHEDGRITCDLCPRACVLRAGDRGFCFVREHRDDAIVLNTYGRSTGFCIDPIEKKPLHHFFPGSSVLSFGTAGCNLGCKFCQNWSISKSRAVDRSSELAGPEAIARTAQELECTSVAFTYNDPVIWAEYAMDTARACRAVGVRTVAVTAGYITPAARSAFFAGFDAANVDLKGFTESFYQRFTLSHLEPVLDTLRWLRHHSAVWLELTTLVIPGANDDFETLKRMCGWIVRELGEDVPLHFTAFHPDFRLNDRGPTPAATLLEARRLAQGEGLRFVYTGNIPDLPGKQTNCPGCGACVIARSGYAIVSYGLSGDRCRRCDAVIPGRFGDAPGEWGNRRQAVRIVDGEV